MTVPDRRREPRSVVTGTGAEATDGVFVTLKCPCSDIGKADVMFKS